VSLLDLHGEQTAICHMLVSAAVRWSAAQHAASLQVEVLAASPAARMIQALGFVRRESDDGPVVVVPPDAAGAATLADVTGWWLMGGDRDV
jgi:hypothetical protein